MKQLTKIPLTSEFALGKYVNLREIELGDAEFVLKLRCDEKKSRFLHKTEYDVPKQEAYIARYKGLNDEYYFIIESKDGKPLGTIRMYEMSEDDFVSGSWLMVDDALVQEVLDGNFLMLNFALNALKYKKFHFDVRKANKKVVSFHKAMGAVVVDEDEIDFFFKADLGLYVGNLAKML